MASQGDSPLSSMTGACGGYGGSRLGDASGPVRSVDLPLDPELLQLLCRRSRKRLREIQERCNLSHTRIDRSHACLCVTGTEAAIHAARLQLESLSGPKKHVTKAFWAELMRTRTLQTAPSLIHVMSLQEATGCRVHIERGEYEVRLFGPKVNVAEAWAAIDRLQGECTEAFVTTKGGPSFPTSALEALGHQCGATLWAAGDGILVLGLHAAVDQTVEELNLYITGQKEMPQAMSGDSTGGDGSSTGFQSECSWQSLAFGHASPAAAAAGATTPKRLNAEGMPQHTNLLLGSNAESTKVLTPPKAMGRVMGTGRPAAMTNGAVMNQRTSHQHNQQPHWHSGATCQTCGVENFCGSCGYAVVKPGPPMPQTFMFFGVQGENCGSGESDCMAPVAGEATAWMQPQQQQQQQPQQMQPQQMQQQMPQQQMQQQQQFMFVPYNGGADGTAPAPVMTQVCLPFGGMMPFHAGMGAQQSQVGMANGGMVEGHTYMVPVWMPQQCMVTPEQTPEPSAAKKFSESVHPSTSLGSLPSVDYTSSAESLESPLHA